MFPIGINRKSMLLQRLLEAPDSPTSGVSSKQSDKPVAAAESSPMKDQSPSKPLPSLGSYDSQSSIKERQPSQRSSRRNASNYDESKILAMEQNFQKFLLQRC